jgi:hypothetical protein
MPGDPEECRAHAKRCWALAAETKNPVLKESLVDLAQRWAQLAADLQTTRALLDQWAPASNATPDLLGSCACKPDKEAS